jgi:3-hydroxybutyryl-CoA dehydrogenase
VPAEALPAETIPTGAITVAIIGAGPLGRRLALHAARAGFRVVLEDVMPASLRHAEESLRQELGPAAMPLVAFASTVEDAVRQADLAIDCVPDELESKLEIFSLLDRMAPPRTVFLTPTTNLSIADLASCTYRPGRCIAIAVNATQLAELSSELGPIPIRITSQTSPEALALVAAFWTRLGYTPQIEQDSAELNLANPSSAGSGSAKAQIR